MHTLSPAQRHAWNSQGFFIVKGYADESTLRSMQGEILDLIRRTEGGESILPAFIQTEEQIAAGTERLEDRVSKVFRIHRELSAFHDVASDPLLGNMLADLLGPDIDCFLSQFIFKLPGALGQPWHQDAFYFHFDRGPQVGVWLAMTEANLDNGPLWILPASHTEPVHDVVPDRREHANLGYVEIVDTDTSEKEPVLMQPGDLLLFHSHLLHCSTDNDSKQMRAAMVYHFASAATRDLSMEKIGFVPPNMDWMPVRRGEDLPDKTEDG